jgi:hypothetical protein
LAGKVFKNRKNEVLQVPSKDELTNGVVMDGCSGCTLKGIDWDLSKMKAGVKALHVKNGIDNKFEDIKFHDRTNGGVIMVLDGPKTDDNTLKNITWENISSKDKNGAEPLRIGNSDVSHIWFQTYCENLVFKNIETKEPEILSIKSCGNTISGGHVENCTGMITVRHGHTNTIEKVTFEGQGGIRLYGKNNKVEGTEHRNNHSPSDDFPPIAVVNGSSLQDPNEAAGLEPREQAEDGHATYTQVKNGSISQCKFINCDKAIVWGRDKNSKDPFKPIGVKVAGNEFIDEEGGGMIAVSFEGKSSSKGNFFMDNHYKGKVVVAESIRDGFSKMTANDVDPIVVPDPVVPDTGHQPPPVNPGPTKPEPDPIIEPAEEVTPKPQVCQVCGKEGAKGKATLYLCTDDLQGDIIMDGKRTSIPNEFQRWWAGMKEKQRKGEIKFAKQIEQEEIDNAEG